VPSSPSSRPQPDVLQHVLDDAEAELRRHLHEACEAEAKGISTESSAEVRRLEDALLAAAMAAEQTITMRRHISEQNPPDLEEPIRAGSVADRKERPTDRGETASVPAPSASVERHATSVREFRDSSGHKWRAWPVTPGLTRASAGGRGFLGGFQKGWICFESLDSPARRRLPSPQPDWANITDEELSRLLNQAIDAPERAASRKDKP
jgi:hypothetical protein